LKLTPSLCCAAIACFALWAVEPLNVKLGQWETTTTTQTAGLPPIPQEIMDKMTPEQRAMMEQRMKGNGTARTITNKSCMTKDDLDKAMKLGADEQGCSRTVITSTSTRQEIKVECNREGAKAAGTVKIEATSSDTVKGSMQMAVTTNGHTMNVNNSFTSKWLGPVCEKEK